VYVCLCNGVTERDIRQAAQAGCGSIAELTMRTGCGATCGSCLPMAGTLLDETREALSTASCGKVIAFPGIAHAA
jgi:bacterioferritin-associated ferredoxin